MDSKSSSSRKFIWIFFGLLFASVTAFSAYQFGLKKTNKSQSEQLIQQVKQELSPEQIIQQDMRKLEARIDLVKRKVAQLDKTSDKLGKSLSELEDSNIPELVAVQSQIDALPRTPDQKAVVLPPESSSAKVLAQPKSASGIPQPVLDNYQKETGVNPAEIEALMRRTK